MYWNAFSDCTSLTDVTIPASVTTISNYVFSGCTNLLEITYTGTKAQWNNIPKGTDWQGSITTVRCLDGDINL